MVHDNKTVDSEGFLLVNSIWNPTLNFTGKVKFPSGEKWWYKNGLWHRDDGPAIERSNGSVWFKNDQKHREDGPAVVYLDGRTEWWYEGKKGLENFPPEIKKKLTRKFLNSINHESIT